MSDPVVPPGVGVRVAEKTGVLCVLPRVESRRARNLCSGLCDPSLSAAPSLLPPTCSLLRDNLSPDNGRGVGH